MLHYLKLYEQVSDTAWPFNTGQGNTKRPIGTLQMVTMTTYRTWLLNRSKFQYWGKYFFGTLKTDGSRSFRIQVDSPTSRFAYIEVVSPTRPYSIRIHRSRFAYIEKKKRSHKHSNRIAIGQRNKLNLNPAICACSYYVSCVIFVWHSERVDRA